VQDPAKRYAPAGLNRYVYGDNRPLYYWDPEGESFFLFDLFCGLINGILNFIQTGNPLDIVLGVVSGAITGIMQNFGIPLYVSFSTQGYSVGVGYGVGGLNAGVGYNSSWSGESYGFSMSLGTGLPGQPGFGVSLGFQYNEGSGWSTNVGANVSFSMGGMSSLSLGGSIGFGENGISGGFNVGLSSRGEADSNGAYYTAGVNAGLSFDKHGFAGVNYGVSVGYNERVANSYDMMSSNESVNVSITKGGAAATGNLTSMRYQDVFKKVETTKMDSSSASKKKYEEMKEQELRGRDYAERMNAMVMKMNETKFNYTTTEGAAITQQVPAGETQSQSMSSAEANVSGNNPDNPTDASLRWARENGADQIREETRQYIMSLAEKGLPASAVNELLHMLNTTSDVELVNNARNLRLSDENQRNNQTTVNGVKQGGRMCFPTSVAMALSNLGIENPVAALGMQYEDFLDFLIRKDPAISALANGTGMKPRTVGKVEKEMINKYFGDRVEAKIYDGWKGKNYNQIINRFKDIDQKYLNEGIQVVIGTGLTSSGHVVVLTDVSDEGVYITDPYGNPRPSSTGGNYSVNYQRNETTMEYTYGENILIPWGNVRAQDLGKFWYMTIEVK